MQVSEIDPWANESKATLRYLAKRSGRLEADCLAALRMSKGEIPGALRQLNPALDLFKFPEWYYMGPFKLAEDPDRDLPIREWDYTGRFESDADNDRNLQGERLIAPFNDSNSLGDILGCLFSASGYPEHSDPGIGFVQWNLAIAADRVRDKLRRNKNPSRAALFEDAVRHIELAKDLYFDRDYDEGKKSLWLAEKLLRKGNKAK
jgi:hypothetical protein